MNLADAVRVIKASVPAVRAAEALGLTPDRHGRCRCVWHEDRHPSMKLYDGDKGCYCFACHNGGDVVDLVMQANRMTMKEAVAWFDDTFSLGLSEDTPAKQRARKAAQKSAEQRKAARRWQEEYSARIAADRQEVLKLLTLAEDAIDLNRPHTYGEDFSDDFCAALKAREDLRQLADELAVMEMESMERGKS